MFDPVDKLALGLLSGIVFGVLLQKGRVAKLDVIVGQLTLKDWTVVKIMATAVAVGAVGIYALVNLGMASLHIKPALLGGVVVGGLLFGAGLAVFGYCPGTGVAASGEGHRDAMVGVAGMLTGAAAYVALYPALEPVVESLANWGKVTFPEAAGTSPWPWVIGLVILIAVALYAVQQRRHQRPPPAPRGGDHSLGST